MIDLLQHTSDLEASRVEHRLSSMLMGIHITQHTSLVDQLLHHSASLLEVLETHRSIVQEDGRMEMSEDLNQQFRLLSDRQRKLADQVKEVKTIPVLTEMKVSSIYTYCCNQNTYYAYSFHTFQDCQLNSTPV